MVCRVQGRSPLRVIVTNHGSLSEKESVRCVKHDASEDAQSFWCSVFVWKFQCHRLRNGDRLVRDLRPRERAGLHDAHNSQHCRQGRGQGGMLTPTRTRCVALRIASPLSKFSGMVTVKLEYGYHWSWWYVGDHCEMSSVLPSASETFTTSQPPV